MAQLHLGEKARYGGRAFTCSKCGRRFRCRVGNVRGKGFATQFAEANRDRHEQACGRAKRPRAPARIPDGQLQLEA